MSVSLAWILPPHYSIPAFFQPIMPQSVCVVLLEHIACTVNACPLDIYACIETLMSVWTSRPHAICPSDFLFLLKHYSLCLALAFSSIASFFHLLSSSLTSFSIDLAFLDSDTVVLCQTAIFQIEICGIFKSNSDRFTG